MITFTCLVQSVRISENVNMRIDYSVLSSLKVLDASSYHYNDQHSSKSSPFNSQESVFYLKLDC